MTSYDYWSFQQQCDYEDQQELEEEEEEEDDWFNDPNNVMSRYHY